MVDDDDILLLLQDDKRLTSVKYSEPQLITAFALALYNMKRECDLQTRYFQGFKEVFGN